MNAKATFLLMACKSVKFYLLKYLCCVKIVAFSRVCLSVCRQMNVAFGINEIVCNYCVVYVPHFGNKTNTKFVGFSVVTSTQTHLIIFASFPFTHYAYNLFIFLTQFVCPSFPILNFIQTCTHKYQKCCYICTMVMRTKHLQLPMICFAKLQCYNVTFVYTHSFVNQTFQVKP